MSPEERHVAALQRLVAAMRERVDFVEGSAFWKARAAYFALKPRFGAVHDPAPPPVPAREYVEAMAASDPYARWLLEHDTRPADFPRLREIAHALPLRPSVAIVVDDAAGDASDALTRARAQIYPWTRTLATSSLGAGLGRDVASRFAAVLAASDDDWIAFCSGNELLAPDAAFEVALAANLHPSAGLIYGDRDTIAPDGARSAPVCAPDWSPDAFAASMYTGKLVFFKRTTLLEAGGVAAGFADPRYDMALRVSERAAVAHRPRVLYSERTAQAPAADDARAVEAALVRRGEAGELRAWRDGRYVLRYALARPGRVEIVLPTRDLADDLRRCLDSLFERTTYADFAVTLVDNGSVEPATAALLEGWRTREPERFRTLRIDEPFNFSRLINAGTRATDGPYVLLLNNDTEILTPDWIEAMLEQAQREPVGAVGARLLYGDGTVQHAGVVIGLGALAGHVYRFALRNDPGPGDALYSVRNYSAVTAACMMVRRDVFEAVGGFDEAFAIEFNDIDFCLRLGVAGFRNVYVPHAELVHYESKSRGIADSPAKRRRRLIERTLFTDRWHTVGYRDPYYNPNLTLVDESARLAL